MYTLISKLMESMVKVIMVVQFGVKSRGHVVMNDSVIRFVYITPSTAGPNGIDVGYITSAPIPHLQVIIISLSLRHLTLLVVGLQRNMSKSIYSIYLKKKRLKVSSMMKIILGFTLIVT